MAGYNWSCEKCKKTSTFQETVGFNSPSAFIWDVLKENGWDQKLLVQACPKCGKRSALITYDFPRQKNYTVLHTIHIIGLVPNEDNYLAMLWETRPLQFPTQRLFDFKYIIGRSPYGLTRPAVLTQQELAGLIHRYESICKNRLI